MTAYNQSVSGSLSFVGGQTKRTSRTHTAAASFAGTLTTVMGRAPVADVEFLKATATGSMYAGGAASASVSFEQMTVAGYGPNSGDASFEEMTVEVSMVTGAAATGAALFSTPTVSATLVGQGLIAGSPSFQALTALATNLPTVVITGSPTFSRLRAAASGLAGGVATASVSFRRLSPGVTAYQLASSVAGAAAFDAMSARAILEESLSETYAGWVMSVDDYALTEYQNYSFDALAQFGGYQWGAGPGGIRRLDGTDDAGENIDWVFRTGWLDGKNAMLKRLDELVLALRFDGPIRVRVWTDEDTYYDYNVVNYRPDVIHQVRAKLGKGLSSRFFRIELSGMSNTSIELAGLQLPMAPTKRRLG